MDTNPRARELRHEVAAARDRLDESLAALASSARPRVMAERAVASTEARARAAMEAAMHKAEAWLPESATRRSGVLIGSDIPRPASPRSLLIAGAVVTAVLLLWRRYRR
ncbi:MAG: hypothetical protein J2P57_02155 [Acidimicrobiaceae bacterium]|nr:hypothetical protein [Acidimicrobiaceae bacterium]